jgi:hypothetical protein
MQISGSKLAIIGGSGSGLALVSRIVASLVASFVASFCSGFWVLTPEFSWGKLGPVLKREGEVRLGRAAE